MVLNTFNNFLLKYYLNINKINKITKMTKITKMIRLKILI